MGVTKEIMLLRGNMTLLGYGGGATCVPCGKSCLCGRVSMMKYDYI